MREEFDERSRSSFLSFPFHFHDKLSTLIYKLLRMSQKNTTFAPQIIQIVNKL